VVETTLDGHVAVTTHPHRLRVLRLIAGYGAIASALPYLALKIVWLSGGSLGVAVQSMMRDASMIVLNAITAGMDLVGVSAACVLGDRRPQDLTLNFSLKLTLL
jgi:hypothetical protein